MSLITSALVGNGNAITMENRQAPSLVQFLGTVLDSEHGDLTLRPSLPSIFPGGLLYSVQPCTWVAVKKLPPVAPVKKQHVVHVAPVKKQQPGSLWQAPAVP